MVHCHPRDNMLKREKMFLTEWCSLDSLENAKNFLRFYHSFHCNVWWMVVLSVAWWRHTPILVLKPTGIVFFRLLVLHEWRSDVTLPTIILVSASVSCAVAWPDFLTTDAVECQRVHVVLPHALTIAPFSFMTLNPLFLGFLYVSAVWEFAIVKHL